MQICASTHGINFGQQGPSQDVAPVEGAPASPADGQGQDVSEDACRCNLFVLNMLRNFNRTWVVVISQMQTSMLGSSGGGETGQFT